MITNKGRVVSLSQSSEALALESWNPKISLMSEQIEVSEIEHQGAVDWAHSIQARQAESLAGHIARQWTGNDSNPAHTEQLKAAALSSGLPQEAVERMFARAKLEKISEFDEPDVRHSTSGLVESLTKTMAEAGMSTGGRRLMISSLASGQVNALCATNSWDEKHYHIFVDSDLTVFCNSIAKLLAETLVRGSFSKGEANLDPELIGRNIRLPELQERAADLFCSAVLRGTPRASKPWAPSSAAVPLVMSLSSATTTFPIAHELGHLNLGHLEADDTRRISVEGIDDLVASVYSHEDEFAADTIGAIVALQTFIRLGVANIYVALAPYIFLKSVETLDACFEVFDQKAGAMSFTHPGAGERARRLRAVIAAHLRYHNTGEVLPLAMRAVDIIMHWILFASVTNLERLKAEGRVPQERVRLRMIERDGDTRILGLLP